MTPAEKEIERIALEIKQWMAIEGMDALYVAFAKNFLAAVDVERGKDAVGYDEIFNAIAEAASPCGEGIGVSVKAFKRAIGGEIFLSPTIPPGFALVPLEPTQEMCEQAYYEFNAEQNDFDAANLYRAMIQAAGVTK